VDFLVALVVAAVINAPIIYFLHARYEPELRRVVVPTYLGTLTLRYLLALYLWLSHTDSSFSLMFWGDSETYDGFGAALAQGWEQGTSFTSWKATVEGQVNRGFIYFVAWIYYFFGHNTLLVQFLNGIIGAATSLVVLEIALLLYGRKVAARAMLFTAFFPQMVFWSSALYKDAAVMLGIGLNILASLQLQRRFRAGWFGLYLLTGAVLLSLRFYVFYAALAATLVGLVIGHRRGLIFGLVSQMAAVAGLIVLFVWTPMGSELLSLSRYFDLQQLQGSRVDLARTGSGFAAEADVSTLSGALQVLPTGVAYLLFAPFPWAVGNLRQLLALPDVLAWYCLMPALFRGMVAAVRHRLAETLPILIFTTALTLAYGLFLGNVGTAYRQRTQIMMFYFIFIADGLVRGRRAEAQAAVESGNELPLSPACRTLPTDRARLRSSSYGDASP